MLTSSLHAELCHVFYRQNQLAHDTPNAREGTTSLSLPRSIMHCDDQNDICSRCAASCKRCPSGPNSQCTPPRLGLGTESRCPTDRAARCDHPPAKPVTWLLELQVSDFAVDLNSRLNQFEAR